MHAKLDENADTKAIQPRRAPWFSSKRKRNARGRVIFFMLPQVKLDEGAIATGGSRGRHATFDEARGLALAPYQPRHPNPIT